MAISAELANAFASVLGSISATEVGHHVRNLRQAGLVSVAGRGASAAQMRADDAINVVLAILGSERVKDSVSTAQQLAALRVTAHRVNWRHRTRDQRQDWAQYPLLSLSPDHTLHDALRCLFGVTALCLGHQTENADAQASFSTFKRAPPTFHVKIFYPHYKANIQVSLRGMAREYWTYDLPAAGGAGVSTGDLIQTREFSDVTVTRICQLLGAHK